MAAELARELVHAAVAREEVYVNNKRRARGLVDNHCKATMIIINKKASVKSQYSRQQTVEAEERKPDGGAGLLDKPRDKVFSKRRRRLPVRDELMFIVFK